MKTWENLQREDLNVIPMMTQKGFTPQFSHNDKKFNRTSPENVPHDTVSFHKDNVHIWKVYDKTSGEIGQPGHMTYGWIRAELANGSFINHEPIEDLKTL